MHKFQYFAHDADTGILGCGDTLEEAFVAAAEAVFAVMIDLNEVQPIREVVIEFEEDDPEYALVTWLNLLLAQAHIDGLLFSRFTLDRAGCHWRGKAWGEPWQEQYVKGTEVKGATLTMLWVGQKDGTWEARCVVDL